MWSEERADALKNLTFTAAGELYSALLSQIHRSLCLLVRQKSLHDHHPSTDHLGLTSRVPPEEVIALSGIYIDDFLTAGPELVVRSFFASLRRMWKTSDPQYLTMDSELPFLGVSIRMTQDGILLYQHHYTQDFLREHSAHISARKRTTSGEPEHFKSDSPLPPDPTDPQHQEWVKRGQRILGGLLWLSTRTRPDLSYSVSSAAQVLIRDLELLKVKLRHLLQYLSTTQTLALLYPYPASREMSDLPSLPMLPLHLLGNTPRRAIPFTAPSATLGIFSIGNPSEKGRLPKAWQKQSFMHLRMQEISLQL